MAVVNGQKRCSDCDETKPVSEFHKNKTQSDGYAYRCKACRKQKEYDKQMEYYWQNHQSIREYQAGYYTDNKGQWAAYAENKNLDMDNNKAWHANRRAMLRGAEGSHTKDEWLNLVSLCNNRCLRCGIHGSYKELERDHIVPITKGGSNYISNIQPLCGRCNKSKSNRSSTDYRPSLVQAEYPLVA